MLMLSVNCREHRVLPGQVLSNALRSFQFSRQALSLYRSNS